MRPIRVEFAPHPIKPPLLLTRRRRWRRGRFLLQREVKALVTPILLGMTRIDAIQLNPQLQPPDRQMREPSRTGGRERRPVVGSQRPRQAVLAKRPVEPGPRPLLARP